MTLALEWKIIQLDREVADGYVFTAHYTISATQSGHTVSTYGAVSLNRPDGDMVPYDSLTKSIVFAWIGNALGVDKIMQLQMSLQNQLDKLCTSSEATGLPAGFDELDIAQ